jgi:UDP-GlcNAc3NAcA epimerase
MAMKGTEEVIVHTGQHFDHKMSNIFFEEMNIPKPDYELAINSLTHGAMTGRMLEKIEEIIAKERPDFVLVYGDTNSTLAGALAASKLHVKIAHVEAGLRSFNMAMPEEINRILTDRISNILFCPTQNAVNNLTREGYEEFNCQIELCGDVMYDSVLHYSERITGESTKGKYALVTLHRQENTDDPHRLKSIVEALNYLSEKIRIIFPIHPRTVKLLKKNNLKLNFKPIDPLGYLDMLKLTRDCSLVLTDSGGLQKEAYFLNKLCITMRDQTEWIELIEGGYNFLAGADKDKIINLAMTHFDEYIDNSNHLYGDGHAAEKICHRLMQIGG